MNYKNIEITVDASTGKFSATINGVVVKKDSRKSIEKTIDKAVVFEAFAILKEPNDADWDTRHELIASGVLHNARYRNRWRDEKYVFVVSEYGRPTGCKLSTVLPDTPHNRQVCKALKKHYTAFDKIREKYDAAEEKLKEKLQYKTAADYFKEKEEK